MTPILLAFVAITIYASLGTIGKWGLAQIPSFQFVMLTMYVLATCALVSSMAVDKNFFTSTLTILHKSWLPVLLFGFLNFVAFSLYTYLLKNMPVAQYQIISTLTPLIGGMFAYAFLHEQLPKYFIPSLVCIMVGIYLSTLG